MRDKWEAIFFLLVFIVFPLIRWFSERFKARSEEKRATSRREVREVRSETAAEEEELPSWFDEEQWEVVEEPPEPPPVPSPLPPTRPVVRSPRSPLVPARTSAFEPRPSRESLLEPTRRKTAGPRREKKTTPSDSLVRIAGMDELRKAIIYTELLGPPRGLKPHSDDR